MLLWRRCKNLVWRLWLAHRFRDLTDEREYDLNPRIMRNTVVPTFPRPIRLLDFFTQNFIFCMAVQHLKLTEYVLVTDGFWNSLQMSLKVKLMFFKVQKIILALLHMQTWVVQMSPPKLLQIGFCLSF